MRKIVRTAFSKASRVIDWLSDAMAESFNVKIKLFYANLRGVADKKFFLFRIANLYDYPHWFATDSVLSYKKWMSSFYFAFRLHYLCSLKL